MDIRVLEYFLAMAREGSITRAAEALHMTQPPLSRALRDLEEELGTQLLIRGRRVELTEDGLLLKQRAREIVELAEKTKDAFRDGDEDVAGDVYIGCGESEGMRTVARAIRAVRQAHPQVRFHLSSGNSEDLAERLDRGLFDFCALFGPCDYARYDHIRLPGRWNRGSKPGRTSSGRRTPSSPAPPGHFWPSCGGSFPPGNDAVRSPAIPFRHRWSFPFRI